MSTTGQRTHLAGRRDWLRSIALLGFAIPALRAGSQKGGDAAPGAKGRPLELETIDGNVIQVHKQPGKVVLVDFMTTTCPSCRQASEALQALYKELGAKGFLAVAIAIDPQAAKVLPIYRNLYGLTFPVGTLPREEVLRYLDHPEDKPLYVPTLVLLDKQGRISMTRTGWPGEQELRAAVLRLLEQ